MIVLLTNYFMIQKKIVKVTKPSIVLVRPQLPENIGMVARAMDNCGLSELLIVSPRDEWPNSKALNASVNSRKILMKAKIYENLEDSLKEFNYVIATSNRSRFLNKPSKNNFKDLFNDMELHKKVAIIFGPENSGLSNDDLMFCDAIFKIDLSHTNQSLNLSHAVLLLSYKWREYFYKNDQIKVSNKLKRKTSTKKEFSDFMNYLKLELENVGFLYPKEKSKSMFNNIQTMFLRSSLNKTEIKTLWGMVKKLRNTSKN
jgi:tRNA/rRNA methyltransferase